MGKWLGTRKALRDNGSASDCGASERGLPDHNHCLARHDLLLNELKHRVHNLTAIMEALGRGSLPDNQPATAQFFEEFMARVRALLAVGEMVISSSGRQAELEEIARSALRPFFDLHGTRFHIEGARLVLTESQAGGIALALHELATNSLKYGALKDANGKIDLTWTVGSGCVEILWKEHLSKPILPPTRQGFGSRLIRYALAGERESQTAIEYEPCGLKCTFAFALDCASFSDDVPAMT